MICICGPEIHKVIATFILMNGPLIAFLMTTLELFYYADGPWLALHVIS